MLQKIVSLAFVVVGALTLWKIANGYIKLNEIPTNKDIIIIVVCIVGRVIISTIKNAIDAKASEVNENINHTRNMKKHKLQINRNRELKNLDRKVGEKKVDNNSTPSIIRKFEAEKVKKTYHFPMEDMHEMWQMKFISSTQ